MGRRRGLITHHSLLITKPDCIKLIHSDCHPERSEGSRRQILRCAQNDSSEGPHHKVYECFAFRFSMVSLSLGGGAIPTRLACVYPCTGILRGLASVRSGTVTDRMPSRYVAVTPLASTGLDRRKTRAKRPAGRSR